jgi:hypothetical protein
MIILRLPQSQPVAGMSASDVSSTAVELVNAIAQNENRTVDSVADAFLGKINAGSLANDKFDAGIPLGGLIDGVSRVVVDDVKSTILSANSLDQPLELVAQVDGSSVVSNVDIPTVSGSSISQQIASLCRDTKDRISSAIDTVNMFLKIEHETRKRYPYTPDPARVPNSIPSTSLA